jgi:hypothetical protein
MKINQLTCPECGHTCNVSTDCHAAACAVCTRVFPVVHPEPEEEILYGCFCGLRGLEIAMTREEAESASHQGQCDGDVAALLRQPHIAAQFDKLSSDGIRDALAEYGAWDEEELADDAANRNRALWFAASDIVENQPR